MSVVLVRFAEMFCLQLAGIELQLAAFMCSFMVLASTYSLVIMPNYNEGATYAT